MSGVTISSTANSASAAILVVDQTLCGVRRNDPAIALTGPTGAGVRIGRDLRSSSKTNSMER